MQHSESLAQHDRSLLLGQPVHRSTHQVATTQKNYEIFENVLQSKGVIDVMQNFIGPESDHWLPLSLTPCTNCLLVNLIDVTLACEDAYSELVEVVTFADVSNDDGVGNI